MSERIKSAAQNPDEHTGIKISEAKKQAVGVTAVAASVYHAAKYMPPIDILKTSLKLNQQKGFDCPGCAWPDPEDERSPIAEYCENGMKAIAEEATKKRCDRDFFKQNSVQAISTWSDFEIGKTGRLCEPMFLAKDSNFYEPISWEAAFDLIAKNLNELDNPDDAIFYTSGRTSNEAAFLYQLFVRAYGTNNLPDCSNMCHESSSEGLGATLGIGKGSVTLMDFYEAEVVMVIGQNPGTNHPRMLSALEKCKDNGGKIITVNPLPETGLINFSNPQRPLKMLSGGTNLSDLFLQVKANGDIALLKAIMYRLWQEEEQMPGSVFDQTFIKNKTNGYQDLIEDLKQQNLENLIEKSGVEASKIEAAVALLKHHKKIIICWAMGITQHENGVANVQEIVNLLLLKGSIGKPGAGTCPVRGHSNVQGDRTMGIWEASPKSFLDSLEKHFGFKPPQEHGYAVVDAIKAMYEEPGKMFFAMGGNFLSATPDTEYTAEALRKCRLTVQISTKLNRSHLVTGEAALILPCLGRTNIDVQASGKQFVSVENSMGVVHSSEGVLPPVSEHLKSEPAIVAQMAKATLGEKVKIDWDKMVSNYDYIREAIEKTIPGFVEYNNRVRLPNGFYLPNCNRDGDFDTADKKAHFTINQPAEIILKDGEYLMMTNRSHDQYNTTIYGLNDRYRGISNERRVVFINPIDMQKAGLESEQVVNLKSNFNGVERVAKKFIVVPYNVSEQCVVTYFPEANVLVPLDKQAKISKTPASKSIVISIHPT